MIRSLTVVLCLLALSFTTTAAGKDIDELVRQLGAVDFQTRERATSELIKAGYAAREAVRQALRSKDPEVAQRAKRIWEKIRLRVFPGAGEDVALLLSKLSRKRTGNLVTVDHLMAVQIMNPSDEEEEDMPGPAITHRDWRVLAKKYGVRFLYLVFFLNDKKEQYGRYIPEACETFLEIYPPEKVMEFSEKAPDKVDKFLDILSSILAGSFPEDIALRGVKTLLLADRPVDAMLFAAGASYGKVDSKPFIESVKMAAANPAAFSDALNRIAEQAAETPDDNHIQFKLCFLAKLAAVAGRKDEIKNFLDNADIGVSIPSVAVKLAEALSGMKLWDEALDILTGITTLEAIYIRALIYRDMGNDAGNVGTMNQLAGLISPAGEVGFSKMAKVMNKYSDPHAEEMWENVLKIPPDNSPIDINAMLSLGMLCEKRGEYAKAAEWYEKTLKHLNRTLIREKDGTVKTGDEAIEAMKANIRRLENIVKGGGDTWKAAKAALDKKDYKTALDKLDAFVRRNPDFPEAWRLQAMTFEETRQLDKALKAVDKAIALIDNDKQEKRNCMGQKYSILLGMAKFDEALRATSQTLELEPENPLVMNAHGMAAFYVGKYRQSMTCFKTAWDMSDHDEYDWLWMFISSKKLGGKSPKGFIKHVSGLRGDKWPIPLLRFYAGDATEKECLAAAARGKPARRKEKECEAYYYIGEWYLWNGHKDKALDCFKKCVEYGIVDFCEHLASGIRIRELEKGGPGKKSPSSVAAPAPGNDSQ